MDTGVRKSNNVASLCCIGLFGTAGLLSNPDFYVLALISLLFIAIAYRLLAVPSNRRLLLISYFGVALYSFIIGRSHFSNHQLDGKGVLLMLLSFLVITVVVVRIWLSEAKWHAA